MFCRRKAGFEYGTDSAGGMVRAHRCQNTRLWVARGSTNIGRLFQIHSPPQPYHSSSRNRNILRNNGSNGPKLAFTARDAG